MLRIDRDDVRTSAYEMIKEFGSSCVMKGGLVASGFLFSSTSYSVNTLIVGNPARGLRVHAPNGKIDRRAISMKGT